MINGSCLIQAITGYYLSNCCQLTSCWFLGSFPCARTKIRSWDITIYQSCCLLIPLLIAFVHTTLDSKDWCNCKTLDRIIFNPAPQYKHRQFSDKSWNLRWVLEHPLDQHVHSTAWKSHQHDVKNKDDDNNILKHVVKTPRPKKPLIYQVLHAPSSSLNLLQPSKPFQIIKQPTCSWPRSEAL